MQWKNRGGRKVIIAPHGSDAGETASGANADPGAGAGASVEAVDRG
jgi:hypothetical protein